MHTILKKPSISGGQKQINHQQPMRKTPPSSTEKMPQGENTDVQGNSVKIQESSYIYIKPNLRGFVTEG